jgi:charged multivesicular body protein 7
MTTFKHLLSTQPGSSSARLPALYSDFRPLKQSNPDGYEANLQTWTSALSAASRDGLLPGDDALVLDVTTQLLCETACAPWGAPLGLGAVVHEAVDRGDWIPLERFLSDSVSMYDRSWSVTGAISWVWRRLVEYTAGGEDEALQAGRFVLRRNLEDAANRILKRASEITTHYTGHIYSPETFERTFSESFPRGLSKLDQLILLRHLSRDRREIHCSQTVPPPRLQQR